MAQYWMNEGGGPILTTPPQPPPPPYPPPDYYDDAGEKNTTPQQPYNHAALITTVGWNQKPPAMPYAPKPMESTSASDALVIKSPWYCDLCESTSNNAKEAKFHEQTVYHRKMVAWKQYGENNRDAKMKGLLPEWMDVDDDGNQFCTLCEKRATPEHLKSIAHKNKEWWLNTGRTHQNGDKPRERELPEEYGNREWYTWENEMKEWLCNLCWKIADEAHIKSNTHMKRAAFPHWYYVDNTMMAISDCASRQCSAYVDNTMLAIPNGESHQCSAVNGLSSTEQNKNVTTLLPWISCVSDDAQSSTENEKRSVRVTPWIEVAVDNAENSTEEEHEVGLHPWSDEIWPVASHSEDYAHKPDHIRIIWV